ncbi:MAG: alternative ribosome rescue aminoacyl-tRNA hydrolase ArfB [Anaerolineales bacterium]|jgi:ribosome-associated protein|nr:alternative ribosome rescue aminoacyl-tRNA hydrolase ArfB [Anaerolineales bacterium]
MIEITPAVAIREDEIEIEFVQASGPGGQNVNKVATSAQLRFDVRNSPSLPEDVRARLSRLAGKRLTAEGVLIIEAKRYRSQEQNRQDAIERLVELIRKATEKPKVRRKTKPSQAAIRKRLEEKRRRGEIKRQRRQIEDL